MWSVWIRLLEPNVCEVGLAIETCCNKIVLKINLSPFYVANHDLKSSLFWRLYFFIKHVNPLWLWFLLADLLFFNICLHMDNALIWVRGRTRSGLDSLKHWTQTAPEGKSMRNLRRVCFTEVNCFNLLFVPVTCSEKKTFKLLFTFRKCHNC